MPRLPPVYGVNQLSDMLNAWVYALSVEKWSDMTVVVDENQMKHLDCVQESSGEAETGWDCLFAPMPHLCTFPSAEVSGGHEGHRVWRQEASKSGRGSTS